LLTVNPASFPDRKGIEMGKDRVSVLAGKVDLRHGAVPEHRAFPEFRLLRAEDSGKSASP